MFKEAGLDIDGVTAGSGGGTSLRNLLASELPVGEVSTSVGDRGNQGRRQAQDRSTRRPTTSANLPGRRSPNPESSRSRIWSARKSPTPIRKSTTEMIVRYALKKENLTDKVEALPLGGLGPALTALSQGAVAAAPLNDPRMTLHPNDYKILFYAWQYYPKFSWAVGVTTKELRQGASGHRAQDRRRAPQGGGIHLRAITRKRPRSTPRCGTSRRPRPRRSCRNITTGITGVPANSPRRASTPWSKACTRSASSTDRSTGRKLIDQEYLDKDLRHPL